MASPDVSLRCASLSSSPFCPATASKRLSLVTQASFPPVSSFTSSSYPINVRAFPPLKLATLHANGKGGRMLLCNASKRSSTASVPAADVGKGEEKQEEEEVELSWVEEKVEDLVEYSSSVVRAIPGPRVGNGDLPWLLVLPVGYMAISLVIAAVKTVRRYTSPEGKRRRQIGKNAWLMASLSEYLPEKRDELDSMKLKQLARKCQFEIEEVLRKFIRFALNERPFNPELVTDLIHLRKASLLDDRSVAEILNEVSRRVVKAKGPVIVDTTGFTEKGLKRKVAVQALFSKILYLAELDEFCSTTNRSSLSIKEIFGVTDEDANLIRIETLSGETEVESLEQLVGSPSDEELDEET